MQPPLSLRGLGLDLLGLGEGREQRPRLGDLRHFRCRRKAFKRGREDGVGVAGAGGRLIELRERKGRSEFEAACSLLLRHGDGGVERFLRRCWVGGIALQQHFAASAMQFRFECAMAQAIGSRQRLVEGG